VLYSMYVMTFFPQFPSKKAPSSSSGSRIRGSAVLVAYFRREKVSADPHPVPFLRESPLDDLCLSPFNADHASSFSS